MGTYGNKCGEEILMNLKSNLLDPNVSEQIVAIAIRQSLK